jgi:L-lysine exporter family protein LysE/ArgO
MIFESLLYGFLWGFALCFTFGPAFFAIIQVSIDSSYKKGIIMTFGVVLADAILMFFAVFGTSYIPNIQHFDQIMAVLGAVLLLIMGFFSIFKNQHPVAYPKASAGDYIYFFMKGLFLNILNPTNFLFVLSTTAYLKAVLHFNLTEIILFFCASLLATTIAETLISVYAFKIKSKITHNTIRRINQISGIVFIIVALKMLWAHFL